VTTMGRKTIMEKINEEIKAGKATITWEQWTAILDEVEERGIVNWVDEDAAAQEIMRLVKEAAQENRVEH